ncbi:MAG: 3-deoxy-8-phosphooctulonate synthase [Nitrospira sp.]|nr:3-deoxy-8-phosphooctulonate synthase [Candidatus Manganitrophaceae bacterium]HIL34641.1 3-deoxy-8-phosphooctulonate synthase [Candidatus Manganitrophaceae bacterium]
MTNAFGVGEINLGDGPFFLIAGPCVIEDEDLALKTAEAIARIAKLHRMPYIYKSSYDKANRSAFSSFRGIGMDQGLKILQKVKSEIGIPVLSDVHTAEEATVAAEVLDILQIPAFLCRQTDLLLAAGKTGRVVNVKKGQFMAPWDMINVVEKLESIGHKKIMLTERGSTFGYNNLVSDMRSLVIMRESGYPVIFDGTHSVQLPGGGGKVSSGQREFVAPLSRSAVATGCDGLFLEVHPRPDTAPSDGPNMVDYSELNIVLKDVRRILDALIEP